MTTKEKSELVILVVGLSILIALIINANRSKEGTDSQDERPHPSAEEIRPGAGPGMVMPSEVQRAAEIKYTGRENRDPLDNSAVLQKVLPSTEEVVGKEEAVFPVEKYMVSAVVWGSKRPQAIVNNKVINIGDMLDNGEIVGIDKSGVHVSFEGQEVLLPIK